MSPPNLPYLYLPPKSPHIANECLKSQNFVIRPKALNNVCKCLGSKSFAGECPKSPQSRSSIPPANISRARILPLYVVKPINNADKCLQATIPKFGRRASQKSSITPTNISGVNFAVILPERVLSFVPKPSIM